MEVKYPKAEMLIVLGKKQYAMYTDVSIEDINKLKAKAGHNDDITFNIAKQKNGNFWYPGCKKELIWTTALINKRIIKAALEVPKPNVKLDYSNVDSDGADDIICYLF